MKEIINDERDNLILNREAKSENIFALLKQGNIDGVKDAININPDLINEVNKNGYNILHTALKVEELELAKWLIEQTKVNINLVSKNNFTALHAAASEGYNELVKTLVEFKADIEAKDNNGWTPLYWAANGGYNEVVEILANNNANIEAKDNNGWTPLHRAAIDGYNKVVKTLLNNNANIEAKDKINWTPLHQAANGGYNELVEILVNSNANIEAKDNNDIAPIHCATSKGYSEVVKTLLNNKASIEREDVLGCTPLHYAANVGHNELVEILVESNANIEVMEKNGYTPLYVAASKGYNEVVKTLVNNNANIEAKDNGRCTPLFAAAYWGHKEVVETLVNNSANLEAKNRCGHTPLHCTADNRQHDAVKLIVKYYCMQDNIDALQNNNIPIVIKWRDIATQVKKIHTLETLDLSTLISNLSPEEFDYAKDCFKSFIIKKSTISNFSNFNLALEQYNSINQTLVLAFKEIVNQERRTFETKIEEIEGFLRPYCFDNDKISTLPYSAINTDTFSNMTSEEVKKNTNNFYQKNPEFKILGKLLMHCIKTMNQFGISILAKAAFGDPTTIKELIDEIAAPNFVKPAYLASVIANYVNNWEKVKDLLTIQKLSELQEDNAALERKSQSQEEKIKTQEDKLNIQGDQISYLLKVISKLIEEQKPQSNTKVEETEINSNSVDLSGDVEFAYMN